MIKNSFLAVTNIALGKAIFNNPCSYCIPKFIFNQLIIYLLTYFKLSGVNFFS